MGGRKGSKDDFLSRVRPALRAATSPRKVLQRLVQEHAKTSEAARRLQALAKASGVEALADEARRLGLIDGAPDEWEAALMAAAPEPMRKKFFEEDPTYKTRVMGEFEPPPDDPRMRMVRDRAKYRGYIPTDMITRWRWMYIGPQEFTEYVKATWDEWTEPQRMAFVAENFGSPAELPGTAREERQKKALSVEIERLSKAMLESLMHFWARRLPAMGLVDFEQMQLPERLMQHVMKELNYPSWLDRKRFRIEKRPELSSVLDQDHIRLLLRYSIPNSSEEWCCEGTISKQALIARGPLPTGPEAVNPIAGTPWRPLSERERERNGDRPTEELSPTQFASLFQEWMKTDD